jgi:hypothetical protein
MKAQPTSCAALIVAAAFFVAFDPNSRAISETAIPSVAVPRHLEAYANPKTVITNATRVINAFQKAQLTWPPYPKGLDPVITPECDREEIRSFYNGYRMAQLAYNMFLSLQETGRFTTLGPVGAFYSPRDPQRYQRFPRRRFVQFGRAALLAAWQPATIRQLIETREALKQWPDSHRRDLSAFLAKLIEYRAHYRKLQAARPSMLDSLMLRQSEDYVWWHLNSTADERAPSALTYDAFSAALDAALQDVSIRAADKSKCLVAHHGPELTIASLNLKAERDRGLYPTKFMVTFWLRRDFEGTGDLAELVLNETLKALK